MMQLYDAAHPELGKNAIPSHTFNGRVQQSLYETPDSPFRAALKAIVGKEPPDYVKGYDCRDLTDKEIDMLQSWAVEVTSEVGLEWMTGIGTIEAAEHMVKCAEENGNIGTNPRNRRDTYLTEEELEAAKEKAYQNAQALVFMECWGSGEEIDAEPLEGYAYVIRNYAPDFVNDMLPPDYRDSHTGVITILANGLAIKSPADVEGLTEVYRYPAGERECPGLGFEEHHTQEGGCHLCGGDDYIYWGDEWQVHVLVEDPSEEDGEDYGD